MKLTDEQKEVIKSMRNGWTLIEKFDGTILKKKRIKTIDDGVKDALTKNNLIEYHHCGWVGQYYQLTDLGHIVPLR